MSERQDDNHMVLPSADDDQVVCTCEDQYNERCPVHGEPDHWESYDEQRQQQIDNERENEK